MMSGRNAIAGPLRHFRKHGRKSFPVVEIARDAHRDPSTTAVNVVLPATLDDRWITDGLNIAGHRPLGQ